MGSFPVLQLQLCFCCILEILTKKTVFLVYIIYFIKGVITYILIHRIPPPPSHTHVHPTPMGMFLLLLPIFFKTTLILSDQNMNWKFKNTLCPQKCFFVIFISRALILTSGWDSGNINYTSLQPHNLLHSFLFYTKWKKNCLVSYKDLKFFFINNSEEKKHFWIAWNISNQNYSTL